MAEKYNILPLRCQSGIKKDGTSTEGNFWNEGVWTRFYRGLPRSMLGFRSMTSAYPGPSRGLYVNLDPSGFLDIFSGSSAALNVGQFTTDGFGSGITDITPSGFASDVNNVWQFDSFYNSNGGGQVSLIAHAAPNLANISNNIATPVYYGNITSTSALTPAYDNTSPTPLVFEVSGGVLSLGPYVVAYGSNGLVAWSDINNPALFPLANQANPTSTKIVKGMSIRGSSAPAALLWSLDSVLQMSFTGGDTVWSFSTLTDQSSILSSSAVVEMDGIYYWPGVDRFLTFNGTLRELPNEMNLDYFYSNLNFSQRQKVYGFKGTKWGEICWCAPMFGSTECNWMFVYNVRENTWYDTPLPTDGRSAAYFAQSWQYPIMFGANQRSGAYQLYQHEYGYNDILGNQVNAIPSYVISADLSIIGGGIPPISSTSKWTQLVGFEPDFLYGSSMNIDILIRIFAQDTNTLAQTNIITQNSRNYFDTQVQGRYIRYKIGSNVQDGYFIMGEPKILYKDSDQTP